MTLVSTSAPAPSIPPVVPERDSGAALIAAAKRLLLDLERSRRIDAPALRAAMTAAFQGSDAEGAWNWKSGYDACEAATVLFLRKFGPALRAKAATPAAMLPMLTRIAALLPTHTCRSEESQALQQFSTPIALGLAARTAAALTPADLVLEPSAGTGLLAILAEDAGASLVLNELSEVRAGLLGHLFPGNAVTRFDAVQINDHLDAAIAPTVVLMNPPFSARVHVDRRVADAALRHIASALDQLADGGRLVAITSARLAPDHWADAFIRLQKRGRVAFSAAIDGAVYARHGTTIDTRLTVIDKRPSDDPTVFPGSPDIAPDVATLLGWLNASLPPRLPVAASAPAAIPRVRLRRGRCGRRRHRHRPSLLSRRRSRSPMRPLTGNRLAAPASPRPFMKATVFSRSASPVPAHTRRGLSSPPPWPRWPRPSLATGRICRRTSSRTACCPTPSSRASSMPAGPCLPSRRVMDGRGDLRCRRGRTGR